VPMPATDLVAIIVLGAVVAGFVQGLSGFGFSLVAMSVWAWTVDPRIAAVLAVFGGLTGQIAAAVTLRRGFHLARLLPFLAGGLLGIPLGLLLLPRLDATMFRAFVGAVLAVWCPAMLFAGRIPRITIGGRVADGVAGACGGVMGALGGATGAIPTLWCTLRGFDKDTQRAVIQNFNLATLGVTMAGYLATGVVTREMLPLFAIVAPAMLVPALLGARLYIGIGEATFRHIVLGLLTVSGVAMLAASLPQLVQRLG
jgi:uncharacterized membrane protein YfcA